MKKLIEDESKLYILKIYYRESEEGKICKANINDINKIDPSVIIKLLLKKMALFIKIGQERFLLDDFPSSIELLNEWNKVMIYSTVVVGHIYFECKKETIKERLLKDKISEDEINKRIKYFDDVTSKVIDNFTSNQLLIKIDSNKDANDVSNQIDEIFTTKFYDFPGGMPIVLFVIGGPGSGKTSVCKYIDKTYGFHHLRVKDILENESKLECKEGKIIKKNLEEGTIVPINISLLLIRKKIIVYIFL